MIESFLSAAALYSVSVLWGCRNTRANQRKIPQLMSPKPSESRRNRDRDVHYDVTIVGAGPSGSTAAYFLGKLGYKVCLIDKKAFPRAKPCGDAWCAPALSILDEMGVLSKMEEDGIVKKVRRGGFVSPFGYKCINTDGDAYGSVTGCKTYAIKRYIADEYLVRAAASHDSVTLMENTEVLMAAFDTAEGAWITDIKMVTPASSSKEETTGKIRSTLLFICDGSTSYLGQKLGLVYNGSKPEAVCSHAYVAGDSHQWTEADGVMIFNKSVLPGYSALFRHYNDDMYLGTYILPGGIATSRAIAPFEADAIEQHPYIKDAFGSDYNWAEKRIVAPIRLGGIKQSYGQQLLLLGDAAGHVDPLTGEGIHTAMMGAKIAAQVANEMFTGNNFSLAAGRAYELRCYDSFVHEFLYSSIAARAIYYFPLVLDAVAVVGQRRGQAFLDFFGETMTGVRPKSDFLQPGLMVDVGVEIVKQFVVQYVLRREPLIPQDIGQEVVLKHYLTSTKSTN